jgi:hypothetical protein
MGGAGACSCSISSTCPTTTVGTTLPNSTLNGAGSSGSTTAAAPTPPDLSLCWAQAECISGTANAAAPTQGQVTCDDQHCFAPGTAGCPGGEGMCYANPPAIPLIISIGGATTALNLSDYIAKVYNYSLYLASFLAAVMFIIGGFQYLTAGGDTGRVSAGKKRLVDAIIGLLLIASAFVVFNTINPDILALKMPKIPLVKRSAFIDCTKFYMQAKCGDPFSLVRIPGSSDTAPSQQQYQIATAAQLASGTGTVQCIGMSCSLAGSNDQSYRCQIDPNATNQTPTSTPTQCGAAPASPYVCLPAKGWGEDCTHVGQSSDCISGFCGSDTGAMITDVGSSSGTSVSTIMGNGTCTNGENGVTCQTGAQCQTGLCQTRGFNHCSSGLTGASCDDSTQCMNGDVCIQVTGIYVCVPKVPGGYCKVDGDCPSGYSCPSAGCGGAVNAVAKGAGAAVYGNLAAIGSTACAVGSAIPYFGSLVENTPTCQTIAAGGGISGSIAGGAALGAAAVGDTGATCSIAYRCRPIAMGPRQCTGDADCKTYGPGLTCLTDMAQAICSTKNDGSPCMNGGDCDSGICVNAVSASPSTVLSAFFSGGGIPGVCSNGDVGERCSSSSDCTTHHCYIGDEISTLRNIAHLFTTADPAAQYGFCTAGFPGDGCKTDADCEPKVGNSTVKCNPTSHMCIVTAGSC